MNVYHFIQDDFEYIEVDSSHVNYYPMLLFIVSITLLSIFVVRFLIGMIFRHIIFKKNDVLSEKIVKKVQNLSSGIVFFIGLFILFVIFFYDAEWWMGVMQIIMTVFVAYIASVLMLISRASLMLFSDRKRFRILTRQSLPIFLNLSNIFFVLITLYIIFAFVWGANMTALLASMGIVGLAISFAAKDTIANVLSGLFIMADQPYRVGDFIDLNETQRGEVISIGIRSTRVLTMSNVEIIIPNSIIGNEPVINESGGKSRKTRINIDVFVAYGADINVVKNLLVNCAYISRYIEKDPMPIARFVKFGDSGLQFSLLCWIEEAYTRGAAIDDLNTRVYDALRAADVEIPYNKHDIYIKEHITQK